MLWGKKSQKTQQRQTFKELSLEADRRALSMLEQDELESKHLKHIAARMKMLGEEINERIHVEHNTLQRPVMLDLQKSDAYRAILREGEVAIGLEVIDPADVMYRGTYRGVRDIQYEQTFSSSSVDQLTLASNGLFHAIHYAAPIDGFRSDQEPLLLIALPDTDGLRFTDPDIQ